MAGDVFISHASEDAGVTAQVCALLEGRGILMPQNAREPQLLINDLIGSNPGSKANFRETDSSGLDSRDVESADHEAVPQRI